MSDTKQLQDVINERAQNRLDKDLRAISNTIRENRLLAKTDTPMPTLTFEIRPAKGDEPAKTINQAAYWMFQDSSAYMMKVREFWLPIYIEEETLAFVKKVDELDAQIQELKNGIQEEY